MGDPALTATRPSLPHNTSESFDRTIRYNAQHQAYEIFKGTAAAPNRVARF